MVVRALLDLVRENREEAKAMAGRFASVLREAGLHLKVNLQPETQILNPEPKTQNPKPEARKT